MSARTRFNRRPSQEALAAIQANLERPTVPVIADIPAPTFGKHEKAWTQESANRDLRLLEYRRDGRRSKPVSSTHKPAHPFNQKPVTEQQFLGNAA